MPRSFSDGGPLTDFSVDARGVHLMMGEHTLCGDAFDAWMSESDWEYGELRPIKRRTVTCPDCARIIRACKAVRVQTSQGGSTSE